MRTKYALVLSLSVLCLLPVLSRNLGLKTVFQQSVTKEKVGFDSLPVPTTAETKILLKPDKRIEPDASIDKFIGPEYECFPSGGKPCRPEEIQAGPPIALIKTHKPPKKDVDFFLSILRQEGNRASSGPWQSKIAFLFLTRGPMPFSDIWERFFKGHEGKFSIYIHTKVNFTYQRSDSPLFRDAQIRSEEVKWGSPNLVDAERRLIASALADRSNERFILLSESCIPIRTFPAVWNYLMGVNLSFVESCFDPSLYGIGRYSTGMRPEVKRSNWRKGSQWWALTREHSLLSIADVEVYAKIAHYCRGDKWHRWCFPDEHYFPTLLHIKDPGGIANRSATFADWTTRRSHPKTFTSINLNSVVLGNVQKEEVFNHISNDGQYSVCGHNRERGHCYLFMRKMDPSSLKKLVNMFPLLGY